MSRSKKRNRPTSHHSRSTRRPHSESRAPQGRGTLRLGLVIAVLVGINLYVFLWRGGTSIPAVMEKASVAGNGAGTLLGSQEQLKPGTAQQAAVPNAGLGMGTPALVPGRVVEGEVVSGDSMGRILRREGMAASAADELIRALSGSLDLGKIRPGQTFTLRFAPNGELLEFEFQVTKVRRVRARRGPDGKLIAEKLEASTELRQEPLGGEIEGSLYESLQRAGEDTSLVSFFVDVFAYDLNFYVDTHPGDTYRMIVEKEYLEGEFIGYGNVLAAEYAGKAGTHRAFWWQAPGGETGKYYSESGQSVEKTFLKTPLKFARVSSGFNPKRMHPVLHVQKGHWGTDYAAPPGTPIWSAAPGRITYRGRRGGAGNCVIVKHENNLQTIYMHMQGFKRGQKVGTRVRAKDVIGYVGSTGLATGPHLHFAIKKNGHYIDPQKMKMARGAGVAKKHMKRFHVDTAKRVALLGDITADKAIPNPFVVRLGS
ncbi:MAG: M23 family metallopeptidase [Myxococcales bacterium]|nr:M23 family metallopeptidase [Myxococcales bacterium]